MQTTNITQRVIQNKFVQQIRNILAALSLVVGMVLMTSADAGACASCGCTLSSMQFSDVQGLTVDLRWDFINQDQLRTGTGTISPVAASQIVNNNGPQEVEQYTINNYVTLGIDYVITHEWGVNVQVPYIDRSHETLGTNSNGIIGGPGGGQYESHTDNFGDIKVIGRYQGFTPQHNLGILFGLKLPTGNYTLTGTSTDPTAPGPVPIDRGLQPGTGTTDVIVGAFYNDILSENFGYFTTALFQAALYSKDQYRPGDGVNLNAGLRYLSFPVRGVVPQVQLNFRFVERDSGLNADTVSTGGTLLYISPGVTVPVTDQFLVYGFVQVPVYQNLNGVQLAPHYTTSVGVRYIF
ncbi:MAG: TonB-dependent receptor [Dissulfurispiraceae bacterium]